MRFQRLIPITALILFVSAELAARTQAAEGQPFAFGADAAQPSESMQEFENKGFKVTYRNEAGVELSKADFFAQAKNREISMTVDGERKTVAIAIGGKLPVDLDAPLDVAPGEALPSLSFVDVRGLEHEWPRADGRFTLFNFYFSACGPCILEIPELNAFAAQRRDVAVLAVTFDSKDETRRFIEERDFAWDIVPEARDFIDALGVKICPTTMLVDPSGKLVAVRDVVSSSSDEAHEPLEQWVSRTLTSAAR